MTKKSYLAASVAVVGLAAAPAKAQSIDQTPDGMAWIEVSDELLTTVDALLPERSAVNAEFLESQYDPNLSLLENSQLGVTFVDEGAGYRNTLGYFTFQEDTFSSLTFGDIDTNNSGVISTQELGSIDGVTTGLVFPNASEAGGGGRLVAGDTVVLGGGTTILNPDDASQYTMEGGTVFEAGTNVGFFVGANAWTGSDVAGWGDNMSARPYYYSVDFLNPENTAGATIDDPSANTRHTAMMFVDGQTTDVLTSFEDLKRPYGDEDFNDIVFFVRSSPESAISQTNVYQAPDAEVLAAPVPIAGFGPVGIVGFMGFAAWRRRKAA